MKWQIPAKTFLLGEYAAIAEASAIILTTTPCFELSLIDTEALIGIHPASPAGIWWLQNKQKGKGLSWYDPYQGQGGLGASSAQFLASYLASCALNHTTPHLNSMLEVYYQTAWQGKDGLRPSGYDVIAQSQQGCVYINKGKKKIQSYEWPFADLSFILLHTGMKLATHHHLQATRLPDRIGLLSTIVEEAKQAFEQKNSEQFIQAINSYHQQLNELHLVAQHTIELIHHLKTYPEILAIKGCGAMGADILLVITSSHHTKSLQEKLRSQQGKVIATEKNILNNNKQSALIFNSLKYK